ncbi:MAG: LTA synthase family protein [Thermoanaerobaculia bacterium]
MLIIVAVGFALRLRIQNGAALPSSDPVLWHLVGLVQDLAVGAVVALLVLGSGFSRRFERVGRWAAGSLVLFFSLAGLARSEAIILFGMTPQAADFETGPVGTVIIRSIRGSTGLLLAITLVLVCAALLIVAIRAKRAVRTFQTLRGAAAVAVLSALFLALFPVHSIHRVETAEDPLVSLVQLVRDHREAEDDTELRLRAPELPITAVRALIAGQRGSAFTDRDFPLAHLNGVRSPDAPTLPAGFKPNIVFFVVESLRAEEVGCYGANVRGVTPNVDALAAEGIRIEDVYSAGTYTPAGELALWYGLLPIPGEMLMTRHPLTRLTGLPEMLRAAGWKSFLWISNTDQTFYHRARFYRPRGFQMFDGTDFPTDDPRVNWGYSDRALARHAVDSITRLQEPFASMVLTVDNHHPYQLPPDAGPKLTGLPSPKHGYRLFPGSDQAFGLHSSQMIQTVHYSDEALGDFIQLARKQPWFSRTIFVISGDHGIPVAPLGREISTIHDLAGLRHHIPLVFYSPLLPKGRVVPGPASQVDVMPTLLGLMGIGSRAPSIGIDLLDQKRFNPDRAVVSWSEHERMLNIAKGDLVYHAVIPVRGLSGGSEPVDEILINSKRDPEGRRNLATEEPGTIETFRRIARAYDEVYPWIVLNGESGLPPSGGSAEESGPAGLGLRRASRSRVSVGAE